MAESLPVRKKKIRLLTPREVSRETGLTQRHLDHLRRKGLIEPVVEKPTPLYSFEQLEEVIDVLTRQAIAVTDLDQLRSRISELRFLESMRGNTFDGTSGRQRTSAPPDEEEAA
jgi:DNA-binding transcriptional MerR regulator